MSEILQEVTEEEQKRYDELLVMTVDFARNGQQDELKAMILAGLPVDLKDEKGNTLLMLASYHGHLETVRMLLDFGADTECRNDRKQTPLGGVAFKGHLDVVELLLERGADPNGDNGGKMPLLFAAMFGRFKVARVLKRAGGRFRA
ncbi:ankyrin repeat domain-containing protein [Puniceicoccaceae bacterium K14]|nr:ankyrin repeat domain-containing protein [Puniceicoccaceae bacterium K14]